MQKIPTVKTATPPLSDWLSQYAAAGGVLDYVLFESVDPARVDYDFHRQAAIAALQAIDRQLEDDALETSQETGYPLDDFFRLTFDLEKINGQSLTVEQFLGPYYSRSAQRFIVPGRAPHHQFPVQHYFLAGDREVPENIVPLQLPETDNEFHTLGYADAFLGPPHGVNLSLETELTPLFHQINHLAFGAFSDSLEIYEWAGDWSNYFDAGFEWWGAYLWTICDRATGAIAAIGASTTD